MPSRIPIEEGHTCPGHACISCSEGPEAAALKQAEIMKRWGWIVHYVFEHEEQLEPFLNVHTHGLTEKHGHPDLQICLAAKLGVPPGVVHTLIHAAVRQIEAGVVFKHGSQSDQVMESYAVRFVDAKENGRPVLRILLPDKSGAFPGDPACRGPLASQESFRT